MSDTETRSVAEIMGWEHAGGYDDRWTRPVDGVAYLAGRGYTPDDMLAWLRERGFNVDIDANLGEQVSVMPWNLDNDYPDAFVAPTLHAALEAAVRAVAEAER